MHAKPVTQMNNSQGLKYRAGGCIAACERGKGWFHQAQDLGHRAVFPPFPDAFCHLDQRAAVLLSGRPTGLQLATAQALQPSKPPMASCTQHRRTSSPAWEAKAQLLSRVLRTLHVWHHCEGGMNFTPASLVLPVICCGRSHPPPCVFWHSAPWPPCRAG